MDWYAIQIITGKEAQVIAALNDFGVEVLQPYVPIFLKSGGSIRLEYRPLMPGYIIAKLEITDFYKYKRNLRIEKMMIRLCGNGYDAIPLNNYELSFFQFCSKGMKPLVLKKYSTNLGNKYLNEATGYYGIINSPPWADNTYIEWYDIDKFKAKLHIRTNGILKYHAFSIAAYSIDYSGRYLEQLQDLSIKGFGQLGSFARQVITV